jgi:hypothetical protein
MASSSLCASRDCTTRGTAVGSPNKVTIFPMPQQFTSKLIHVVNLPVFASLRLGRGLVSTGRFAERIQSNKNVCVAMPRGDCPSIWRTSQALIRTLAVSLPGAPDSVTQKSRVRSPNLGLQESGVPTIRIADRPELLVQKGSRDFPTVS